LKGVKIDHCRRKREGLFGGGGGGGGGGSGLEDGDGNLKIKIICMSSSEGL
jgi:hypothetical protein